MSNFQLGPCEIYSNTDERSLGMTLGGVSVKIEQTSNMLKTDQTGETPVDEVITGTTVTVEANLAEITLDNLATLMKTTVSNDQVKITPMVGTSLMDNAKELVIKPYVQGVVTTNDKDMILIPKAGIKATANLTYNANDQRVINMTIVGYPDSTLSGSPAAVFGASVRGDVL